MKVIITGDDNVHRGDNGSEIKSTDDGNLDILLSSPSMRPDVWQ